MQDDAAKAKAGAAGGVGSLGDACVAEAMAIIAQVGVEGLSLREVARRLGISHQAPYKHFASRDHLLAEVIRRCFRNFAQALRDSAGEARDPAEALHRVGLTYLRFAETRALEYRLMFSTPWPQEAGAPEFVADARAAFDVLKDRLQARYPGREAGTVEMDALFVWSAIHGLATVRQSSAMGHLDFDAARQGAAMAHALAAIDRALG